MNILQTLILAVVEGITEFLPISSTGHLILTSDLLKIVQTDFFKSFEIAIQLGAVLSVVALYARTLLRERQVWRNIFVAFIPTGVLGLLLYKVVKTYLLGNELVVVISLLVGGAFLIFVEKVVKFEKHHITDIGKLGLRDSFVLGLCQSLAMIPGVSRSAATIVGGMFLGMSRTAAAEFSFLLAIPTMAAATMLDLVQSSWAFTNEEYFLLALGFVGSFFTALIAVRLFIRYVQTHNFVIFGVYRIVLAIVAYFILVR